ncbi:type II secretion system protein [bacterium]|nr:type II secretion system protein [bacterium]
MNKKQAFTLAETLIVMGVIGVVAALTLPNLNSSTGDKEKVTKLKKIYSNLNDAYGRATAVYGPIDEWGADSNKIADRFADFLKISKSIDNNTFKAFVLSDGTYMEIEVINDTTGLIEFFIDIDGKNKGQNNFGYDSFVFYLSKDTNFNIEPYRAANVTAFINEWKNRNGINYDPVVNCTGWVIDYGNMDYLKLDSSGKCPNGTQLSETVTSCK